MVSGVPGARGVAVVRHVAPVEEQEQENATIQHPRMEENNVLVTVLTLSPAEEPSAEVRETVFFVS